MPTTYIPSVTLKKLFKVFVILVSECTKGSYGSGCNETCGHCRHVSQCFHINGSCPTGCDTGYQGGLCKSREYIFRIYIKKNE